MKPPQPAREKNVEYPEIAESSLSNGIRVLVVPNGGLPRITVKMAFPVGYVSNPDDNPSFIPLALELLKGGTKKRSAREIAHLMDRWAIEYRSNVFMEHSLLSMTFLEEHVEHALDLLADMVGHPRFPEDEFRKVQTRWKSSLIAQRSDPNFLAVESAFKTVYEHHPYSKINLRVENLEEATSASICETYRSHWGPNGAYLLFAGPINEQRARELAERFFGFWKSQDRPEPHYPPVRPIESRTVCLVHRPHSVQTRLLIAGRALPKAHPDTIPAKVANQILGGGASARLFINLREQKGYTYGAYSRVRSYRQDGLYLAGASIKTDVTGESIEEVIKELSGMRREEPAQNELTRSQSELAGSFIREMETADSIGSLELERRLYDLPEDYYRSYVPTIRNVTTKKVLEVSRELFDPDRVVIVVVSDRDQVEGDLREFGELRVYDTQGNEI